DIRLDLDAVNAANGFSILIMERELNVGLTKLDLFIALSRSLVQQEGGIGENVLRLGLLELTEHSRIGPTEEAVLVHLVVAIAVPDHGLQILERSSLRQVDLAHCRQDIEKARQHCSALYFFEIVVSRRRTVIVV